MLKRVAPALSIPSLMVLLVGVEARPPRWMVTPPPASQVQLPEPPAPAPKPAPAPRKIPAILAVDQRIRNRVNGLRPAVKKRLAHVAKRLPKRMKLLVTSAYRTRQEQANLRPTFGVKAKPGHSAHEDGRAIDLNVLVDGKRVSPRQNRAIIGQFMAEAGFKYLGDHDPVHFSIPKHELDLDYVHTEPLEVMTMTEVEEVREQEQLAAEMVVQPLEP
jgi:hypothetical protein